VQYAEALQFRAGVAGLFVQGTRAQESDERAKKCTAASIEHNDCSGRLHDEWFSYGKFAVVQS
jgi:hypothetical protein